MIQSYEWLQQHKWIRKKHSKKIHDFLFLFRLKKKMLDKKTKQV